MLNYTKFFLIFLFFFSFSSSLKAQNFNLKIIEIRKEINRDDIKKALKLLGEIKVASDIQQEKVDLLFGDIYLKINKPEKAIEFYEKAFMTSDSETESLSELGLSEANLRKGNLSKAVYHAKRSVELDEDNLRNKIVLAISLTRNGEKDEALQILENLYINNKNNSEIVLAIAGYHSTFENNKKALEILDKFLKRFPTSIRIMDELGNLYWIEGNKEKALELKSKVFFSLFFKLTTKLSFSLLK